MRILANYSYKGNGDSYSVTFETMGDVQKELANATVDELFRLAKEAIQRQLDGNGPDIDPVEPVVPQPRFNNNDGKPRIRDPFSPPSPKQVRLIKRLAKEKDVKVNFDDLTKGSASELIDELMAQ